MIALDECVHLLDDRIQRATGRLLLGRASGIGRHGRRFAVHDLDLGGRRAEAERIVPIGSGATHDVMGGGGSLAQHDEHHRDIGLLNRVDEALPQPQHFGFLSELTDVDA